MVELGEITIHDSTANPAPLGLMGFGLTTILLNIHNAGFYELNSMILAMGVFYGGLAQVIAGLLDFRKGNEFGATAFLFVGSLRTTRALQAVFAALTLLFILLAIRDWTGSDAIGELAGWEGILTGLLAVYTATAQIWNDVYGRTILPLGSARR